MQSPYILSIASLKIGVHHFEYLLENDFFIQFNQYFNESRVVINIALEKKETFLQLHFTVEGLIHTMCEKCNCASFPLEIWDEFNLIVKYATNALQLNESEEDPDIFYILPHEAFLDLKQYLYEFTMLSMPLVIKCSHQQFIEKTYCNQEVLKYLSNNNNDL